MSVAITMEDGVDSLREGLNLVREEYEDKLEYEPGFWEKAWKETKKRGHAFLVWLGNELKMIWERGGREVVTLGVLIGLSALFFPAAVPVLTSIAPVLLARIIYHAFREEA